jgi:hypothetical protein
MPFESVPSEDADRTQMMRSIRGREPTSFVSFAVVAVLATTVSLVLIRPFNQLIVRWIIQETAEAHGLNPEDFARMAEIESGFNPYAYHPISGASGLFQFVPATAGQYGLEAVFNARANANAAAELWRDNERELRRTLRRRPTAGEIYLAHQQGAGGALALLTRPDEPAIGVLGYDAVTLNGGNSDMTAKAFAARWVDRFQQD